jgi:hypothetical protein
MEAYNRSDATYPVVSTTRFGVIVMWAHFIPNINGRDDVEYRQSYDTGGMVKGHSISNSCSSIVADDDDRASLNAAYLIGGL